MLGYYYIFIHFYISHHVVSVIKSSVIISRFGDDKNKTINQWNNAMILQEKLTGLHELATEEIVTFNFNDSIVLIVEKITP